MRKKWLVVVLLVVLASLCALLLPLDLLPLEAMSQEMTLDADGSVYMVSNDHDRKVLRLADQSKVYRMVSSSYNPGDYTYYQDGAGLENGSLLLATDAQYAAMDPELAARFEKTDLPQFWLYMDATGYSTNDPQPYNVYYCADGGIDLSSLPY